MPAGSAANASSVGAKTVNGPSPRRVSSSPAAWTPATRVSKSPAATAVSTMSASSASPIVVVGSAVSTVVSEEASPLSSSLHAAPSRLRASSPADSRASREVTGQGSWHRGCSCPTLRSGCPSGCIHLAAARRTTSARPGIRCSSRCSGGLAGARSTFCPRSSHHGCPVRVAVNAGPQVWEPTSDPVGDPERLVVRVAVTGATGFVGSALTRALEAMGHEVTALTRHPERYTGAGTPLAADIQDVRQPASRAGRPGCRLLPRALPG